MAQGGLPAALGASQQRQPWSEQEDGYLVSAVEKYGTQRWSQIARGLVGRSSKACSHRWRTYLQPGVKRTAQEPFSEWEIAVVTEAHRLLGNQWSTIARMLPGRTNAAVKNFWHAYARGQQPDGSVAAAAAAAAAEAAAAAAAAATGLVSEAGCCDDDGEGGGSGSAEEEEEEEADQRCAMGAGCAAGPLAGVAAAQPQPPRQPWQQLDDGAESAAGAARGVAAALLPSAGASGGICSPNSSGAGGVTQRSPLRIKLGRGVGLSAAGSAVAHTPALAAAVMMPPRASAAGGGGSPILHSDGSLQPSESQCHGLQLQASSQMPLQAEHLGLGAAACMRRSSDARQQAVCRLGSCGVAGAAAADAAAAAGGVGAAAPTTAAQRSSDSSCTGASLLLGTSQHTAAPTSSPFAAAPQVAAAGTAAAVAATIAPGPGLCLAGSASGRLPSAPSRGLSGLLWETTAPGGCGADGAVALREVASQELLLEAFRDMQGSSDDDACGFAAWGGAAAGCKRGLGPVDAAEAPGQGPVEACALKRARAGW